MLKFPLKEMQSALRYSHNAASLCIGGSKTGRLSVWEVPTGTLLGEVESAHYMELTDLDIAITNDMVITGGKDQKVKVWIIADLFFGGKQQPFVEFSDHTAEVTQVCFSRSSVNRAFSCSVDKTFKVYDVPAGCTLKSIQAPSPINRLVIDAIESNVYLACDNQNVYGFSLELTSAGNTT